MAFAVVAALLSLRLVYLQAIAAPDLASKAERARMSYSWDEPRRGTIYDRNGVVLATSVEASTIYVDPAEVDDPDTTAQVLVDVLGGRKSDYLEAVTAGNTPLLRDQGEGGRRGGRAHGGGCRRADGRQAAPTRARRWASTARPNGSASIPTARWAAR